MLDQYRLSLLDQQSMRLSVLLARHSALFGPPRRATNTFQWPPGV